MKRLAFLLLIAIVTSCSPRPDSYSVMQTTKVLMGKRSALMQVDTLHIRQLLSEVDLQLEGFRSVGFSDTLSLAEGRLIDSVLTEKKMLHWSIAETGNVSRQLGEQIAELNNLRKIVLNQRGTVSERNQLILTTQKDAEKLSLHIDELVSATSENQQALSQHIQPLKKIANKYFH